MTSTRTAVTTALTALVHASAAEVADTAGISVGTARNHLAALEAAGVVRSRRGDSYAADSGRATTVNFYNFI